MRRSMQAFETRVLEIFRVLQTIYYIVLALLALAGALWLTAIFGMNVFMAGMDFVLGLVGLGCLADAFHTYASDVAPEQPDRRERYLESRMLHAGRRRPRPEEREN